MADFRLGHQNVLDFASPSSKFKSLLGVPVSPLAASSCLFFAFDIFLSIQVNNNWQLRFLRPNRQSTEDLRVTTFTPGMSSLSNPLVASNKPLVILLQVFGTPTTAQQQLIDQTNGHSSSGSSTFVKCCSHTLPLFPSQGQSFPKSNRGRCWTSRPLFACLPVNFALASFASLTFVSGSFLVKFSLHKIRLKALLPSFATVFCINIATRELLNKTMQNRRNFAL